MAALESLLDEVALEGLDGITFSTLWFRLDSRIPPFPLLLDAPTKQFVWEALAACPEISFFQLPHDRPSLVFHDRYEEIDPETGIQETRRDPTPRVDIYPVHIISDNKDGIQGSCQYFYKRKDITSEIRTQQYIPLCTLEEAVQRWGEKLVMVASQMVRHRALIGWESDPELALPDYSYCILERLGRARWQGELQRDLHSGAFKVDARKMHYHRRVLDRNNLITLQSHVIRQPNGNQQYSILLLLKRFHVDRRSKYDILMEKISHILVNRPNQLEVMLHLRDELGLCERTFKKLYQYMVTGGIAKVITVPLKDLNPEGGPCLTKKGTQIIVRCLKLIKPYGKKVDEEDEEDEDNKTVERMDVVYERDMLTQAYELIEKRGTRGISQTEIRLALNVGKLEGRMLCRLLERYKVITGFMEDEGRQRTTKYVAKTYVKQSELSKQFEKEKARSERLATISFLPLDHAKPETLNQQAVVQNLAESESTLEGLAEDSSNAVHGRKEPVKLPTISAQSSRSSHSEYRERKCTTSQKIYKGKKLVKSALFRKFKLKKSKLGKGRKLSGLVKTAVGIGRSQNIAKHATGSSKESQQIDIQLNSSQQNPDCIKLLDGQSEQNVVIEEVTVEKVKEKSPGKKNKPCKGTHLKRPHETFRMLKRQNLILEAVRNLKLIESLFSLQKMIMEEEKQDGVVTRCCKKSIVRMVQKLSQEGLLRLFRTTVIQDGISKKVEFVAHPSVLPNDPLVKSAIEQVRFRISSSYTVHRMKVLQLHAQKEKEKQTKENASTLASSGSEHSTKTETTSKGSTSKTDEKMGVTPLKNYRPVIVPGLGRSLGFLPKMPRLRLVHTFLWYIVYGHPLRRNSEEVASSAPSAAAAESSTKEASDTDTPKEAAVASTSNETSDVDMGGEKPATDETPVGSSTRVEIGGACQWEGDIEHLHVKETVYVDEATWKRYCPPIPIHREFGHGWALISDILLCVPLSIFVQIVQVSHKVENLDEFLNDHYMKHTLVRDLPQPMRQQLLYKRRYIFSIFESLQRLCYMGLLQFGPTEKFQEKDQIFVYIKKNAMIVDTTSCDPHYNLARSSRPFDNRCYALNSLQDVESFWFDLMCVCLNTPLGVIRFPRLNKSAGQAAQEGTDDTALNSAMEQEATTKNTLEHKCSLLEHTTGSRTLVDDGKLPGDGLGAAGLDSSFFGHLKRNWIWTSYIINNAKKSLSIPESSSVRLQSFLNKHSLPLGVAGNKFSILRVLGSVHESLADHKEEIRIEKECNVDRSKRVAGGKGQKRKRPEGGKKPRKKRRKEDLPQPEKTKRFRFQDDADRSALRRMTKLRVTWTAQEDSLLMLCRVASHVLNKKVKGPFVPWQTVRDVMHNYLEVALDKTSLAVGRRSRYILKNPQTMLNYRICLAEVYEDHALINEIMNKKDNYQDSKVCAEEFKEFVGKLRQKFTSAIGSGNIEIPDTLQELFARFKILVVGEEGNENQKQDNIKSVDDIHYLVLQNFIQSTLALSDTQMKSCQSFQTFHLYKQYKDEVLVKVFLEFQQRSLVNRRRVSKALGPKKSRALPFAPMSYQLSQAYYRNFMWRFPSNICSESYNFVQKLKSAGKADIPNTFSFQDKETPVDTEVVTYPLDGNGGYCVATISLFILGLLSFHVSIPEQIVVVDSTLVDNEVIKRLGKEGIDDYEDDDLEETGNKPKFEVKAPQASHTNYLLMRGYYAPGIVSTRNLNPNDNIVVNSCQVRLKVRSTPFHGSLSTHDGSATLFQTASGPDALPRSFTKVLRPNTDAYVGENIKKQLVEEFGYSPEDLASVQEIASEIEACSSFGMETVKLGKKFDQYEEALNGRTKTLKQYLQSFIEGIAELRIYADEDTVINSGEMETSDLTALDQMIEVGGSTARLVAVTHAYPWLLHPFRVRKSINQTGPESPTDVGSKERTESSAKDIEESTEGIDGNQDNTQPHPISEKEIKQHGLESITVQSDAVHLSNIQILTGSRKRTIEETGDEIVDHKLPTKIPHQGDEPAELSCHSSVRGETPGSTMDETKAGFPCHHTAFECIEPLDLHIGSRKANVQHSEDEDGNNGGGCEGFGSSHDVKALSISSAFSQPEEQSVENDGEGRLMFSQHTPAVNERRSETIPPADGQVLLQEDNCVVALTEHLQQDKPFQVDKSEDKPKLQEEGDDTVGENVNVESILQAPSESECEQISFVCHPWRIVDGSLNKPVCKGMVEAMLYHIMTKPGITEQKLLTYYRAVLQPVIIQEILQALETIGCIRKRYLTRTKPVSLFSAATSASEVQGGKLSESFTVFYEPTIDCVLRLGKVFPYEPNWNKWIQ